MFICIFIKERNNILIRWGNTITQVTVFKLIGAIFLFFKYYSFDHSSDHYMVHRMVVVRSYTDLEYNY